jgi:hypothetical protein
MGDNILFFPAFILIFIILLRLATSTREIISGQKITDGNVESKDTIKFFQIAKRIAKKWLVYLFVVINLGITYMTLNLGKFSYEGAKKNFIYLVAVPGLIALSVYLIIHIAEIMRPKEWGKNAYGAFFLLFLILLVCIPLAYGRYVFDLPVHLLNGFEYDPAYKTDMMREFRDSVNRGGAGKIYYMMGHTSGKEVFFQAEKPPAQLILFDSEAVKFIRISREGHKPMTLRDILGRLEVKEGKLPGDKGEELDPKLTILMKRP